MYRFASLFVLCLACTGCPPRLARSSKAPGPQEIVFADGTLRTVVPPGWSGVKDATVTDGELVTMYPLMLRRAPAAEIGLKTYPTSASSALGLADRLRSRLSVLPDATLDELAYDAEHEDRASFRYSYSDPGGKIVNGKVTVVRLREGLGVMIIGTWPPESVEDAASFEAVVAALKPAGT